MSQSQDVSQEPTDHDLTPSSSSTTLTMATPSTAMQEASSSPPTSSPSQTLSRLSSQETISASSGAAASAQASSASPSSPQGLLDPFVLQPSSSSPPPPTKHARNQSASSDVSQPSSSSGFDYQDEREAASQDDIDNTPATSYGGFLSFTSDDGSSHGHLRKQASSSSSAASDAGSQLAEAVLSSAQSESRTTLHLADDPERLEQLRAQVESLFEKLLPHLTSGNSDNLTADPQGTSDAEPTTASQVEPIAAEPTLLSRNLPAILTEFEKQRGHALIDPKVYAQLEQFTSENPDVPISSTTLVSLIHALESSAQNDALVQEQAAAEQAPPPQHSQDHVPELEHTSDLILQIGPHRRVTRPKRSIGRRSTGTGSNDSNYKRRQDIGSPDISQQADGEDAEDDEHLVPDLDSSRDDSREITSVETAFINNLKEDLRLERSKVDALQQTLSDKERRVNALEHKLVTLQEQHEESMLEEQSRLEEVQNQIAALRKEEKELRIKHKEILEQNNLYEVEMASLTQQIEVAEKANVRLKRELEDEQEASSKMKHDLDRRVKEYKELSGYLVECESLKDQAETSLKTLKDDFEKLQSESIKLKRYKEESQELKDTVDKLELELDEIKRVASFHSKELSRDGSATGGSAPSTLSKRLGNELARSINLAEEPTATSDGEDTETDDQEGNMDDFIETVIQRRHRRRVGGKSRKSVEFVSQGVQTHVQEAEPEPEPDEQPPSYSPAPTSLSAGDSASSAGSLEASNHPMTLSTSSSSSSIATVLNLLHHARMASMLVALFSIGLGLGLMLNTSRDLYHAHLQSFDAQEFRRLNHIPMEVKTWYYDSRYPNAVVGSNLLDDWVAPVLDAVLGILRLGGGSGRARWSGSAMGGIVYD